MRIDHHDDVVGEKLQVSHSQGIYNSIDWDSIGEHTQAHTKAATKNLSLVSQKILAIRFAGARVKKFRLP